MKVLPWVLYTYQLFLRNKREIFILEVLGFSKTTRSFPKIPEEVGSLPKTSEVCRSLPKSAKGERAPSAFHFKNQRSRGRYCHLFILHMAFVPYMGLSEHIFGNCVKQDGNNSHFSIRREKLARRREPAWDRSFQPVGVRLTPKAWELAGIRFLARTVKVFLCSWLVQLMSWSMMTSKLKIDITTIRDFTAVNDIYRGLYRKN